MGRRVLIFLILLFLFSFLFQGLLPFVKIGKLNGSFKIASKPTFACDSILSGNYQTTTTKWVNENFGFRNTLVRLHNQLGYWMYHRSYTNNVTIGKEEYLFDIKYINAYTGADFIGEQKLRDKVLLVKKLQDSLKSHGIEFLFVIAPGKASFFNEYIPDKYLVNKHEGNYETIVRLFKEYKINHIDFRKLFDELKPKSQYPLFPKCGIHWSTYGAALAADSIIKRIEKLTETPLPHMIFDSVKVTNELNTVDQDVGKGMNLLWNIENIPMAYPSISYTKGEKKIKLLTIADSYNWTMPVYEMSDNVFKRYSYIYYNKMLYANIRNEPYSEEYINRARLLLGQDVIMVLSTDANLAEFGWNFFEGSYFGLFELRSRAGMKIPLPIATIMNDIRFDSVMFYKAKLKAKELKVPADSVIYMDALLQYQRDKKKE